MVIRDRIRYGSHFFGLPIIVIGISMNECYSELAFLRKLAEVEMPDTTPEREEIARRIRTLRTARGYSIQRLAELAGISAGYLSEVERGLSEVSGVKLARLAEHLGVSTDYLLSGRKDSPGTSSAVQIPPGLSEAAKELDLTYAQTLRLLAGKESLVARRANTTEREWTKDEWKDFHAKVARYL